MRSPPCRSVADASAWSCTRQLFGQETASCVRGIPITSAARTLVDLAGVVNEEQLEISLDDALRRKLTTLERVSRYIGRCNGRGYPGIHVLRKLLDVRSKGIPESPLETKFLRLIRAAKLPLPLAQYEIRHMDRFVARVDFAYPDAKLAIEIQSWQWHSSRRCMDKDVFRRNELIFRIGWTVLEVTSKEMDTRPLALVDFVRDRLRRLQ